MTTSKSSRSVKLAMHGLLTEVVRSWSESREEWLQVSDWSTADTRGEYYLLIGVGTRGYAELGVEWKPCQREVVWKLTLETRFGRIPISSAAYRLEGTEFPYNRDLIHLPRLDNEISDQAQRIMRDIKIRMRLDKSAQKICNGQVLQGDARRCGQI